MRQQQVVWTAGCSAVKEIAGLSLAAMLDIALSAMLSIEAHGVVITQNTTTPCCA